MLRKIILIILAVSVYFHPHPGMAQQDTQGCKDHPLYSRMTDFYIYNCKEEEFGQLEFRDENGEKRTVEGHKYFLEYYLNSGAVQPSHVQIFRNFEHATKSIVGKLIYKDNSWKGYFQITKGSKVFWVTHYPDNGEFYHLTIIEEEMEQEIVADAASLERDIALTGHAAVYGIFFDFDKDKVKPE